MLKYNHERGTGERYAAELDKAAGILERIHPIGEAKGIGRLEVATALGEIAADLAKAKAEIEGAAIRMRHLYDAYMAERGEELPLDPSHPLHVAKAWLKID